ncbi:MAG: DNA topoisomerase IV subunit A [Bacilli bacterium]|nr:DNA topoisomerase IV subunit A [Bacilli bacterium]
MAKKKQDIVEENFEENISTEPLEDVMSDRYATYAKYVIQDRAIPDVRDGLKPVQRRIIFSMYKSGNTFNKPTKKCAHTVGAVMGTYHPHGDISIYEALARMSQDWKVRYPLIDFQGNNGSIDGDSPAAYRYTESRLSELSNELISDIEKQTVDMQLNFDDTEFEPVVLPSRFPNLLVNGTEGIAVALATEIPPHNLREVIEAVIYRIGHKTATVEDLMQFVQGPDFPGGGYIYKSSGLESIYQTGRGRIEVSGKAEIVEKKDINQIIITEIPYKVVKIQLVYEIDKIRHSKAIDGIIEVRDESDYKGIRIVVDVKKNAKADLILQYLMKKTNLLTGYTANMVAIVDGRPKTLNLLDFVDAYIAHQVDVVTRKSKFDLKKYSDRLHIVDGLILASLNINEVVDIIRKSKDKADSKINLINRFDLSNEQAEAIVTMPLYKLSHTDEIILEKEKAQLQHDIQNLNGILEDPAKLNRVLIRDLKYISDKYGDERRTLIAEKGETKEIDKRELIAKEEVMVAVSFDGYLKRSSIRSFSSSNNELPGLKSGDMLVGMGKALTTDYLICFTNLGNYAVIGVHNLTDNKWKDEGTHINEFTTLASGEKIIKVMSLSEMRNDLYLGILTKFGQIKRMAVSSLELVKRSRPAKYMKLLTNDSIVGIELLTGDSDLLVITNNGNCSLFNENELTILGSKAGGVKSISQLGSNQAAGLLSFEREEKSKIILFTNKGHMRVTDTSKFFRTNRLGKVQSILQSFKGDQHSIVYAMKCKRSDDITLSLYLNDQTIVPLTINDFRNTEAQYAKKNIDEMTLKQRISFVFDTDIENIGKHNVSHPIIIKESPASNSSDISEQNNSFENTEEKIDDVVEESNNKSTEANAIPEAEAENKAETKQEKKEKDKEPGSFEQISIFDDLD